LRNHYEGIIRLIAIIHSELVAITVDNNDSSPSWQ
jgi:hypothetical protein